MDYEPVIGLEIHARVNSKTKMFCRCNNDIFDVAPNTYACPICMGFPGMLPVINQVVIKKGIKVALALGCTISEFSKFDRKSYFYPDLPKGFQISQYDRPVSGKGRVIIALGNGSTKDIGVTRLHLEDDAGKLTHATEGTLVDFNRSGTPLMEIVSEPDLRSPEEASAYARQIQKIVRYVDASDADMEKGQMRFDINVSLRPRGSVPFGTRVEVKNLNSFRMLEKALIYEIKRQQQLLNDNGQIVQETRGWDDDKGVTVQQRSKEAAADYRYFPEPDIPPLVLTRKMIEDLKKEIPELSETKAHRYQTELGLSHDIAHQLTASAGLAGYFETAVKACKAPRKTANWILSELMGRLNADSKTIADSNLSAQNLGRLVGLIEEGVITGKIAKDIFKELYEGNLDPEKLIETKGLKVVRDTGELERLCRKVLEENGQIVQDIKNGKKKAIGALIGQVMVATKGSASPKMVNKILAEKIKNSS